MSDPTSAPDRSSEPIRYPELPPELRGGIRFRALKYFGAGAIIASVTIGSGETLFASRGGAVFGYTLLWCFVFGCIMKGIQVYTSARYMTLTGDHPMAHWAFMPGPRRWVPIFIGVLSIACFPFWLAGLPLMLGTIINWMFNIQGSHEELLFYARCWGTACIVVAVTLTWFQGYNLLEKVQTAIVALLLFSMIAACFAANPDWMQALAGTFIPALPEYQPWIHTKYPDIAITPTAVEVGIYMGALGGGSYDYIGYIGCFREKRWGAIGLRQAAGGHDTDTAVTAAGTLPIDTSDENVTRGRKWLIPTKVDVGVGFFCVVGFTICFVILGAAILHPQELIPAGNDLMTHQAKFLTDINESLLYLYKVGVFMAFFGTIYGAYEIYIRTAYECLMPISAVFRKMSIRPFRLIILLYCAIGGMILMWTIDKPIDIVKFPALFGGVFLCGLWCFAMLWVDRKFLPQALRMRGLLTVLTWISGIGLTATGALAIHHSYWGVVVDFFGGTPGS